MKAHYAYLKDKKKRSGCSPGSQGQQAGLLRLKTAAAGTQPCHWAWKPQHCDSAGTHAPAAVRGGQQDLLPLSVGQHSRGTSP